MVLQGILEQLWPVGPSPLTAPGTVFFLMILRPLWAYSSFALGEMKCQPLVNLQQGPQTKGLEAAYPVGKG